MVPEAAFAMLACARIGAPHSVVFAGFSADAIRDRCLDAEISYILTADQGVRGGRKVNLKEIVDKACKELPAIKKVLMYQRTGAEVPMVEGRDLIWADEMARQLGDPTSWLLTKAKLRGAFGDSEFKGIEKLGTKLADTDLHGRLHAFLGKKADIDEVVGIGKVFHVVGAHVREFS